MFRSNIAIFVHVGILIQKIIPKNFVGKRTIKVISVVMMGAIMQDVNGMAEIVVVAMVIQINTHIVMLVNVWILNFLPQAQLSQPQPQLPVP